VFHPINVTTTPSGLLSGRVGSEFLPATPIFILHGTGTDARFPYEVRQNVVIGLVVNLLWKQVSVGRGHPQTLAKPAQDILRFVRVNADILSYLSFYDLRLIRVMARNSPGCSGTPADARLRRSVC
jgi:hypothetical protein